MEIREDDLTGEATIRFLGAHLANMVEITPPGSVHALAVDGLRSPDITLWSAWDGDRLLGCGALRAIDADSGEIKAMRTDESQRRRRIGSKILEHIIAEARSRGYRKLLLETGAKEAFAPARALYARYGFERRGPFGDYGEDPNSVFMEKQLS